MDLKLKEENMGKSKKVPGGAKELTGVSPNAELGQRIRMVDHASRSAEETFAGMQTRSIKMFVETLSTLPRGGKEVQPSRRATTSPKPSSKQ